MPGPARVRDPSQGPDRGRGYYLRGLKTFVATDPGLPAGSSYSTRDHPIQGFSWSDYTAKPGHKYTYRIEALTGDPATLTVLQRRRGRPSATEAPAGGTHDVYFNRGVAASQAYAQRFGDRGRTRSRTTRPASGCRAASTRRCAASSTSDQGRRRAADRRLRVPLSERSQRPRRQRSTAGVDIKVVYDARRRRAARREPCGRWAASRPRCRRGRNAPPMRSAIAHNKFIVKLEDGRRDLRLDRRRELLGRRHLRPQQRRARGRGAGDRAAVLDYWRAPPGRSDELRCSGRGHRARRHRRAIPRSAPASIVSPRRNLRRVGMVRGSRQRRPEEGLFMTFAFGMNDLFKDAYRTARPPSGSRSWRPRRDR